MIKRKLEIKTREGMVEEHINFFLIKSILQTQKNDIAARLNGLGYHHRAIFSNS